MDFSDDPARLAATPWAWVNGRPTATARFRVAPEDFVVDEVLGFSADGTGEHYLLRVRKRGANTDWVARQLAGYAGVKPQAVSYAGLKDRDAVTSQWFSVQVPIKQDIDWMALSHSEFAVVEGERHSRKLRRGAHRGNRFTITLRDIDGDRSAMEQRLAEIAHNGVPNYFGPQRFGHGGNNLSLAAKLLSGERRERDRNRRSLALSAARSLLFNQVLSLRVERGLWATGIDGDVLNLNGRSALFDAPAIDAELERRIAAGELHPTGPLWGRGGMRVSGSAAALEEEALAPMAPWCDGLERAGLEMDRRPLRLPVSDLRWSWLEPDVLELSFTLAAGAFATAVLREFALVE